MRYTFAILIYIYPILIDPAYVSNISVLGYMDNHNNNDESNDLMKNTIRIKVGDKIFTATLLDNATANAFKAMLPLTINMTELNGNEKYFRFSNNLPMNASNPGTINAGDLMFWGADTIVLFYKRFSTSYTYTKVGKIDDPTGLAAALGSGNVMVTFEL